MTRSLILIFSSLLFLSGCLPFGGDKEIRRVVANGLSPKTLYDAAEEKVDAGSIDQAIEQYEIILESYPGSKYAIQARLDIAYNLFKRKKYDRALIELNKFIVKYPSLPSTPYAFYLRGVIAEDKSSSILDNLVTDSAQRDVKSVSEAYSYYVELIDTFPNSKYSVDAEKKLAGLINTLAKHEFYVALYYTETGSHIAALNRIKFIIQNYPNSSSIADGIYLMAYNYDQINANKLAIDTRQILTSSFPGYSPNFSID
tara:strand:+ start:70 stop:840 length:771 start_codon:yes stop_codon:yes gene_type:complete